VEQVCSAPRQITTLQPNLVTSSARLEEEVLLLTTAMQTANNSSKPLALLVHLEGRNRASLAAGMLAKRKLLVHLAKQRNHRLVSLGSL